MSAIVFAATKITFKSELLRKKKRANMSLPDATSQAKQKHGPHEEGQDDRRKKKILPSVSSRDANAVEAQTVLNG
jgi:hypothetical protein